MKKTFKITHPKIKPARMFESIKHEVKKYLKRERNKACPEGVDFWDFECQFGVTELSAESVHLSKINSHIDQAEKDGLDSFYIEVLAKPGHKPKK
jgi:hypothetical protein